jgi:hypothetical protein
MFLRDEPTAYIASEFLLAPGIYDTVKPGSKFARALTLGERSIARQGFDWWQPPAALAKLVEITRNELARKPTRSEKIQVLAELLSQDSPTFLQKLTIPEDTESE